MRYIFEGLRGANIQQPNNLPVQAPRLTILRMIGLGPRIPFIVELCFTIVINIYDTHISYNGRTSTHGLGSGSLVNLSEVGDLLFIDAD